MNVNDFEKYILKYLDGDLTSSELDDFNKIIKKYPECRKQLSDHQSIVRELSNIENISVPEGFTNRLYDRIEQVSPGFKNRVNSEEEELILDINKNNRVDYSSYNNYMPYIRIAAGLAIFIFSISVFLNSNNISKGTPNKTLSAQSVEGNSDFAENDKGLEADSSYYDKDNEIEFEGSFKHTKHKK